MDVEGQRIVITGGASGMGAATAILAASRGAKVCVADVDQKGGAAVVEEIRTAGGDARFILCDMSRREDIEALIADAASTMGGLDVLHNNAAVIDSLLGSGDALKVDTFDMDVWHKVLAVNLTGPMLAARAAVPYLKSSKNPSILNVASISAFVASPGTVAYSSSKAGVAALTKSLAVELAPYGIRANCYCPGVIETGMLKGYLETAPNADAIVEGLISTHLVRRLGQPVEVAELACFLAGSESRFINGVVWLIDGGSLAWRGTTDSLES